MDNQEHELAPLPPDVAAAIAELRDHQPNATTLRRGQRALTRAHRRGARGLRRRHRRRGAFLVALGVASSLALMLILRVRTPAPQQITVKIDQPTWVRLAYDGAANSPAEVHLETPPDMDFHTPHAPSRDARRSRCDAERCLHQFQTDPRVDDHTVHVLVTRAGQHRVRIHYRGTGRHRTHDYLLVARTP